MDEVDRAQIEQERTLQRAISAARGVRPMRLDAPVVVCVECGADIEAQRQQHGLLTCFECAAWLERMGRTAGLARR
jgi:RNA polymerase-binding transcription factor DksA